MPPVPKYSFLNLTVDLLKLVGWWLGVSPFFWDLSHSKEFNGELNRLQYCQPSTSSQNSSSTFIKTKVELTSLTHKGRTGRETKGCKYFFGSKFGKYEQILKEWLEKHANWIFFNWWFRGCLVQTHTSMRHVWRPSESRVFQFYLFVKNGITVSCFWLPLL